MENAKALIVNIGDELLIGQILNTNATWMSERLNVLGIQVLQILTIADNEAAIVETLQSSIGKYSIILMTGGLGPTKDDITKSTLARYFGGGWRQDEGVLVQLEAFFASRNRTMNEANRSQAHLPKPCETLMNKKGTAPGMWFEKGSSLVVSMPGVPYEMQHIMETGVIPRLKERFALPPLLHKTFHTEGIPESELMVRIADWESRLPDALKLAYLPSAGRVKLRLTCLNQDGKGSVYMEKAETELREILGGEIYGVNEETLAASLVHALLKKEATLATAESCTGGTIAKLITSVPGVSATYLGGFISYDNSIKISQLGVPPEYFERYGAVSAEVVEGMAEGIRRITGADYSMASSGIAGPDGGTLEKPVGMVWIGISSPTGTFSRCFRFGSDREGNMLRSSQSAINLLRKVVLDLPIELGFWEKEFQGLR